MPDADADASPAPPTGPDPAPDAADPPVTADPPVAADPPVTGDPCVADDPPVEGGGGAASPASDGRRPYVLGGRLHRRPSRPAWLAVSAIMAVVLIPLRGLYRGTGSSMEEGFMLVFPERMLAGDVPNVDFLHLYGPGSLHVLMGWYQVFGTTLEAQRGFGLLQHLGIVFGIYALCRVWGHLLAAIAAVTAALLVLTPIGLSALAWEGAVALAVWSVVFGVRALHTTARDRTAALVASGALAGFALSFRPDLILALGLAHGFMWWRGSRTDGLRAPGLAIAGSLVGLVPMWIHLAVAGIPAAWRGMVTEPVRELRPGRELPQPPSFHKVDGALQAVVEGPADAPWWRIPAFAAHHQLWLWFWVVIATAFGVVIAAVLLRRRGDTPQRLTLLCAGLLGLGLLPQALQRPDSTHLAWGSCVSFALVPAVIVEVLGVVRPRMPAVRRTLTAGLAVAVAMAVVMPFYTYRSYLLFTRISVGDRVGGYEVARGDRRFYFGNEALQRASQAAIDELDRSSTPGERLLVGPADLSRTIYSDVVFYFMFPELVPATYFIEMDPGLADDEGSSLADDVASADWLLLTNFWTGWYEPNASSIFGSDAPNQVVASRFCLVGNYEDALVLLLRRCRPGETPIGVSPAGIGIGADRRASLERELAENS